MALDTVGEIKNKLTISDVVAPYVKLRRAGRSLIGLCPFHKEKTPSFHVSLERGSYHCFGCGEGGDMFSFIQKAEGLDFKGALTMLAERAGVRVEYSGSGGRAAGDRTERFREVLTRAAAFYAGNLASGPALEYAKKRGLTAETITAWGLGYARDEWRALLEHLTAQGFTIQEMLAAGVIKEAEGKPGTYYDRFRNRLMFPIRDVAGRVVAFTGRALSAEDPAKYLNSPETDLYHKSEILFGLDRAKDAIRTRGFTLLVEGQIDVIHAHQAGFHNTVALSGTAFTERHVALMKRYGDNLMLALDADPAGLKASANAALLALKEGLRVKAARLPVGEDPADLIGRDPQEFAVRIKDALPITDFFLAVFSEQERDQGRLLRAVEGVVLPLVAAIVSPMERERAAQAVARALGLSLESVRESLKRAGRSQVVAGGKEGARAASPVEKRASARESRGEFLRALVYAYPGTPLAEMVEREYTRITGDSVAALPVPPEPVVFLAEQSFGEAPREEAVNELLGAFEAAVIREAYQEAVAHLRKAEATGDAKLIKEAGARCAELQAKLAVL